MAGELSGKSALVTGSGRNIGAAIALELAALGSNVLVHTGSDENSAQAVAAQVRERGVRAAVVVGDLSDPRTVDRLYECARLQFGGLDVYVSNVASRPVRSLAETSFEQWFAAVDVQLNASFRLAHAFVPTMVERGWGRIIHITGPSAFIGVGARPHVAAKGGLRGLTKSLAIELGPHGITVNDVAPGEIETDRTVAGAPSHEPSIPVGRRGQPADVAYACGFLASHRAGFISGSVVPCSGGQWMVA